MKQLAEPKSERAGTLSFFGGVLPGLPGLVQRAPRDACSLSSDEVSKNCSLAVHGQALRACVMKMAEWRQRVARMHAPWRPAAGG